MPEILGLTELDAVNLLQQVGLEIEEIFPWCLPAETWGVVVAAEPAAGAIVPRGSGVEISVNKSYGIPDVFGYTQIDAENEFFENCLYPRVLYVGDPDQAHGGLVIGQEPGAGDSVPEDDIVTITITATPPMP